MTKYSTEYLCPVCGKHKGRGFNHEKCSKIMQKRRQAEMQERDKHGITLENRLKNSRKQAQKHYLAGDQKQWWPD